MKQLPTVVLKGHHYVGASLYNLHVPYGFVGRLDLTRALLTFFPLGLLAAATLVGSGTKMKLLEPGVNCGFLLCQV